MNRGRTSILVAVLASACATSEPPLKDDAASLSELAVPADQEPADVAVDRANGPEAALPDVVTVDASPDVSFDAAEVTADAGRDAAMDTAPDSGPDAPPDSAPDTTAMDSSVCPSGRVLCGGECVDLTDDANHCGRCGNPCATGERCAAGACGRAGTTWSTNATERDCDTPGVLGMRVTYECPPGGTPSTVWGTGVYTHDSSVCGAAVHAGRITAAAGGSVTIEYRPGQAMYQGSERNGVTTNSYPLWRCSYAVVAPTCAAGAVSCGDVCARTASDALHCGRCDNACPSSQACTAGVCGCPTGRVACGASCVDTSSDPAHCGRCDNACGAGSTCVAGVCGAPPSTWSTNATDHDCATPGVVGMSFTYRCPAGGSAGTIWGTDVYTHDSSVCTAGVHTGRITLAAGGTVTIQMAPGQAMYTGSMRNGISSNDYGTWGCSYTVR